MLDKPSGLPTTSPDDGECLARWAREFDRQADRMHASSRLDAEVTGLVTFALTTRAIAQLMAARNAGQYRRFYLGLAPRAPEPEAGEWRASIGRDPRDPRRRVAVASTSKQPADAAWTRYRTLQQNDRVTLLLLMPETGRTHQLRVHAAHAGIPLWGDRPYGGSQRAVLPDGRVHTARRVMLHCVQLMLPDVETGEQLVLRAPPPPDWQGFFTALGGDPRLLDPSVWPE